MSLNFVVATHGRELLVRNIRVAIIRFVIKAEFIHASLARDDTSVVTVTRS